MRNFLCTITGCAIGVLASANPTIFDDALIEQVKDGLTNECGAEKKDVCQRQFETMMEFAQGQGSGNVSIKNFIDTLEHQNLELSKQTERKMGALSFLQDKAKGIDLSVPCYGTASCMLAEKAINACNFGRVLTMINYQTVNINAHILNVISSLLCACVYVGDSGICLLAGKAFPICEQYHKSASSMFQSSVSSWEAVKAVTRKCAIHGDPKVVYR